LRSLAITAANHFNTTALDMALTQKITVVEDQGHPSP